MIKCKSLEDVKRVYGEGNLIKIVNIKQIVMYTHYCQPVWIDEGYEGKLVCYYLRNETDEAWRRWLANKPN